ncbi:PAS domain-containing protein [Methylobacterium fujisawaense]|uniref:PAS domain-containing protein n=1 Tax=Methylobacterium fujisawaense TaxID=107400 RepID=UPI002F3573D5
MIWLTDPSGQTIYMGPEWYALTGLQLSETLGKGWTAAIHPDERALICDAIAQACTLQCEYVLQFRLKRTDGVYIWVVDAAAPSFLPGSGKLLGFLGMIDQLVPQHAALIANAELKMFRNVPAVGDLAPQTKLELIADHILAARAAALEAAKDLLPAIDALLFVIGRSIAQSEDQSAQSDSIH